MSATAAAIEQAAQECLSAADVRARRREREQSRRADQDVHFRGEFAAAIREQFPGCPVDRAEAIALHAAARGSGRVGRSAAGRSLDPDAVRLAVVASVRHVDIDYDTLLMSGVDRESARAQSAPAGRRRRQRLARRCCDARRIAALSDVRVVAGRVITAVVTSAGAPGSLPTAQWAHIAWADHEALGGPIAEIDTMAVLTRHDKPIDSRGVEMGASTLSANTHDHCPRRRRPGCTRQRDDESP